MPRMFLRGIDFSDNYCAVSVKVVAAPPTPNSAWALTVTVPAVDGKVSVTDATPEEFVVAITLLPLLVPLESVPAFVLNKMLAPEAKVPDEPGDRVMVRGCERVVPRAAVCPLPVEVTEAGGLPTTIQPLWVEITPDASCPVMV